MIYLIFLIWFGGGYTLCTLVNSQRKQKEIDAFCDELARFYDKKEKEHYSQTREEAISRNRRKYFHINSERVGVIPRTKLSF